MFLIVNNKTIDTSFFTSSATFAMDQILNELGWHQLVPAFKSNNIDLSTFQPLLASNNDFSGHEGTLQFFERQCGISSAHLQLIC